MAELTSHTPTSHPGREPGDVWYYAFGSNMNPTVLTGRRRVQPKVSLPAKLDGWVLGFNMRGVPYVEPGMATILPYTASDKARDQQAGAGPAPTGANGKPIVLTAKAAHALRCEAGLHGVLHLINAKEWETVKITEGVRLQGLGYQVVSVTCELYNGAGRVEAYTLVGAPFSVADPTTILPSVRYLNLIREGARIHGVDPAYCAMLDAHPAFEPQDSWGQYLGRVAMGATALGLAMPLMPLVLASAISSRIQTWRGKPPGPAVTPGPAASRLPEAPTTTIVVRAGGEEGAGPNAPPPPGTVAAVMATKLKHGDTKPPPGSAVFMLMRTHLGPRMSAYFMQTVFRVLGIVGYMVSPVLGSGFDNSPRQAARIDKKAD